MFQRILVPLDGSTRAERALPVAAKIARASGGSVVLLRVIAPVPIAYNRYMSGISIGGLYGPAIEVPPAVDQEAKDGARDEAKRYLEVTAASRELQGITVETTLLFGAVASNISSAAQSLHTDLIVLCSRGYTGFKRWVAGSVAQHLARQTPVPVLILHEERGKPIDLQPGESRPVRVLVPLDGSSLAEEALVPAAYLSAALSAPLQAALHLTQVIRLPAGYEYAQMDSVARARRKALSEAHVYLRMVKQRLRSGDLAHLNAQISSSVAVNRDVAELLMSRAEHEGSLEEVEGVKRCDVIALVTQGRSGLERWVRASVTERLLGATKLPLLIVRPASMRDDLSRETAVLHEGPGRTTRAQPGETEGTAAQAPSWVGLF